MMTKNSQNNNTKMYLLRFINAICRGGDYSFIVLNMVFGIFFASLTGNPLLILGSLCTAFCIVCFTYKTMQEEFREQQKVNSLKNDVAKIPTSIKLFLRQEQENKNLKVREKTTLLSATWTLFKKALNRIREFASAFNDGVKLIISLLIVAGFTLCSLTPIVTTLPPFVVGLILLGGALYAGSSLVEYQLKRHRKHQKLHMEKLIHKNREIKLGIYNTSQKKPPYILTTREELINYVKFGLSMIPSFLAGTFFGFSILNLVFGYIVKPLALFIPGLPLITEILIPGASALLFGLLFMTKSLRDESASQKNEAKALKTYYHRLDILTKLHGGNLSPEIRLRLNPIVKKDEDIALTKELANPSTTTFEKYVTDAWIGLQKLGNRLLDAFRGTRNFARFTQFAISAFFVTVSFGACGIGTGMLSTLGLTIFVPIIITSLLVGTAAFIQDHLKRNRDSEISKTQAKTQLVDKEIAAITQQKNLDVLSSTPGYYEKIYPSNIKTPTGDIISGYSIGFFKRNRDLAVQLRERTIDLSQNVDKAVRPRCV